MRSNLRAFACSFLGALALLHWAPEPVMASNVVSQQVPPGAVYMYGGTTCPRGSLTANGTSYLRTTYPNLYAAIGTNFGSVDGTHFSVPDMRGMFGRGDTTGMGGTLSAISSNNGTVTNHGFNRSGVPVRLTGTPPTGLSTGTTYYTIYIDANTIAFATTVANALAATKIAISGTVGAAVIQWVDPDSSSRFAGNISASSSSVGSVQWDEVGPHTHNISSLSNTALQAFLGVASTPFGLQYTGNTSTDSSTGTESRPKNIYFRYCIKF